MQLPKRHFLTFSKVQKTHYGEKKSETKIMKNSSYWIEYYPDLIFCFSPLASSLKEFSSHLLPKRPAKKLRNTLEKLREKLAEQIKKARELEAHNDETIDFEFKMKKPAMLLEMEIREAFLVFMVCFF